MHKPPTFGEIRFSCPHCGAFTHHHRGQVRYTELQGERENLEDMIERLSLSMKAIGQKKYRESLGEKFSEKLERKLSLFDDGYSPNSVLVSGMEISRCDSCGQLGIWLQEKLVYPRTSPAGLANSDMPAQVKALFDEAGAVFQTSPRAAAALLRLALQHLLKELGEEGKNIDKDINSLIDKGLDANLSKVFHSVRIIGNESVHPGEINVDDEPYMAEVMFGLLNQIVDQMISNPAKIDALWDKMPENKRNPVEQKLAKRETKP